MKSFENLPQDLQETICLYLSPFELLEIERLYKNLLSRSIFWSKRIREEYLTEYSEEYLNRSFGQSGICPDIIWKHILKEKDPREKYFQLKEKELSRSRKFYELGLLGISFDKLTEQSSIKQEEYLLGLMVGGFEGRALQIFSEIQEKLKSLGTTSLNLSFRKALVCKDPSSIIHILEKFPECDPECDPEEKKIENQEEYLLTLYKKVDQKHQLSNLYFPSAEMIDTMISLRLSSPRTILRNLYKNIIRYCLSLDLLKYFLKKYKVSNEDLQELIKEINDCIRRLRRGGNACIVRDYFRRFQKYNGIRDLLERYQRVIMKSESLPSN